MLETNEIYCGDCRELLQRIDSNSIDACVTDPPYELAFMGKHWDKTGIAYNVEMWREVYRTLKPGAHLLAFGGTRTAHRVVCAIEDAGFEIRDTVAWLYGSGFPKSLDIGKAIDKELGAEREIIGDKGYTNQDIRNNNFNREDGKNDRITAPSSHAAKLWDGWGTALKPAHEPICVARKPIDKGNIAKNVLEYGTGGINIYGAMIPHFDEADRKQAMNSNHEVSNAQHVFDPLSGSTTFKRGGGSDLGRYPSNVLFDEEAAELLEIQRPGASRFFYVAKASRSERDRGLTETKQYDHSGPRGHSLNGDGTPRQPTRERANTHPTVKPIEVMRRLVKLVTPRNGIVLDPFAGSGSTCMAAKLEFCRFIGMDLNPDYCTINDARLRSLQDSLFDEA